MLVHYTQFTPPAAVPCKCRKQIDGKLKTVLCDDNIYCCDTETTSLFKIGDRVELFDKRHDQKYYRAAIPVAYMYIWVISVNDIVYYGRTGAELVEFMTQLHAAIPTRKIIYIHNLSYDFQFIRNYITDFEVFARSPRQPLTAYTPTYNAEFRDSLALTNCKLEKLTDVFKLPVRKKTGDLDYNIIRNSKTPLTDTEMEYVEYDARVLYHLIYMFKSRYKNVCHIPLTQTGIVRRECQAIYAKNVTYHRHIKSIYPHTAADWYFIMRAFWGGYVHANYLHAGKIINRVQSYDFTSSYPTVMLSEKYPQSPWIRSGVKKFSDLLENDYCYILDITFDHITAATYNHYLSRSKCYDVYNVYEDNGRVVSADNLRVYCTNIDLQIIRKTYKFKSYTINKALRSRLDYLDKDFMLQILKYYTEKTALKGVDDLEYALSKQKLNGLYGMSVTNIIKDSFGFEDNEWLPVHELTDVEVNEKLIDIGKSFATFLSPAYGVFVTAYARKNLWDNILKIDRDLVYADTDSIKFVGDHMDVINAYNKKIIKKLRAACKDNGIDPALLSPADAAGVQHHLGIFDNDGNYEQFVTLGAKKYATVTGGELHITVSGVNSKTGAAALGDIRNFKNGFVFDYDGAGKQLISYNDRQSDTIIIDAYGNAETRSEIYGVNLRPNVYHLGMSFDYMDLIEYKCPNYSLRCSNIKNTTII
jgi:hypothetical protein